MLSMWGLVIESVTASDVDDSELPAGDLIQHIEDDEGWWASVARRENTIEIRIYDVATVWLDVSDARMTVRPAPGVGAQWLSFQLQLYVLPVVRMLRGDAVFHAGAVLLDQGAVLLLADGHGGKSTTTALLLGEGAGFLSDDQTGVTPDLRAVGTSDLWLRAHSASLAVPRAATRPGGDGRTVVEMRPTATHSPIVGLITLGARIDGPEPAIHRIDGGAAVAALLAQIFSPGLNAADLIELHFRVAGDLAANLPVARLHVPRGPPWPNLLPTINHWLRSEP